MIYLDSIVFPNARTERGVLDDIIHGMTCFDTVYPFGIFTEKGLERIDFDRVTILYGSNESGKSTALNVIADKIGAVRVANYIGSTIKLV